MYALIYENNIFVFTEKNINRLMITSLIISRCYKTVTKLCNNMTTHFFQRVMSLPIKTVNNNMNLNASTNNSCFKFRA